ncbi:crotonobetainyl-CoA:carnitine CoA-transferase CaiB-like acyl-CoA transferase [Mycobacterium frederiksbergense]|uniref:Crotonobetainyl-CoA:carnitine CoA-transferase CaiB-like acyl-CoA transferase n=1 Tax=Mycolicibacterium frederiksbergense TaxID=117567 RepID=A0ABT6KZE9_9MYCO|nr:CoA transferase [Mycolicibacterium frederiksbergense]MDH6196072.1 crotonobetainyl-CoA:carnitine CoA-transferase CaiB-like acyl-CoA transferase [Mycolicibacterium frederiksbergense]
MSSAPLAGVRVLDFGGGESDGVTRLLADLGADVLKIEPPGGSPARLQMPMVEGTSIPFAINNANKRSAVLDPESVADRKRLVEFAGTADIIVDGGIPGGANAFGTSFEVLAQRFDHLVALSVTDFGSTGPYATWRASDAVLCGLSTALSRTGPASGTPVLPPGGVASATAVVQATWAVLAAYYRRLRCGKGDYIDLSRLEAILQCFDPPFGAQGQAASGQQRNLNSWRGRPRNQQIYPIFPCKDGYVRISVLSPRQWRGMRAWLGEPDQFADPRFESVAARYTVSRELNAAIAEIFAPETMDDLVAEGQQRGVPLAAVLTPAEALSTEHFRSTGALIDAEITAGGTLAIPAGPFLIDGRRAGYVRSAPSPGVDETAWLTERSASPAAADTNAVGLFRPFDGMRIIDLGVIVAGGELGRLFADLGAEVIKVESADYPDGLRQAMPGEVMSRSWAVTHRNQRSIGLDLRHPSGADLFSRLVAEADAVFANFKPGTLASLGFSYETLRNLNPRIVLAESSAFGATGPWSTRMGYGPLVRAATGITRMWTSEHSGHDTFYDATTVFPDHVVARITAIAALAAIVNRDRTGIGAHVHISQAEVALNHLAAEYVVEAARCAQLEVADETAVHAVYPCRGDDEWCVISVQSDLDRTALATVMGRRSLPQERSELIDTVAKWTAGIDKNEVANLLQRVGMSAAPMLRVDDVLTDPQIAFRNLFTDMVHPLFDTPIPTETGFAPNTAIPPAELRPAPMPGEHTHEICHKVLRLDADEIDRLIAEGVMFTHQGRSL